MAQPSSLSSNPGRSDMTALQPKPPGVSSVPKWAWVLAVGAVVFFFLKKGRKK